MNADTAMATATSKPIYRHRVNPFGLTSNQLDSLAISLRRRGFSAHVESDADAAFLITDATRIEVNLVFGASYWLSAQ